MSASHVQPGTATGIPALKLTSTPRKIRRCRMPIAVWSILLGTLLIALVRSLGNQKYGSLPAFERLESIKFLDPVLVILFLGLVGASAIQKQRSAMSRWKALWLLCIGVILLVGVLGSLVWRVHAYYAAQSMFFVLRPALLFLLFASLSWGLSDYRRVLKFIFTYGVLNALVTLYQQVVLWRSGEYFSADAMIGLFNDAHQQATFSYALVLLLLGCRGSFRGRTRRIVWLALVGLYLLAAYVSQGQKATAIFAVVLGLGLAWRILRHRRRLALIVSASYVMLLVLTVVFLLGAGGDLFNRAIIVLTGNLSDRLAQDYRGRNFLGDLGVLQMVTYYRERALDDPVVAFVGLGPSNFGSPACLAKVAKGSSDPWQRRYFWWETAVESELIRASELRLLGLSARTSVFGVALGELGLLGFAAFLPLTLWPLRIRPPQGAEPMARDQFFWSRMAYLFVVLQAAVSTLGAWDHDVMFTVLLAGMAAWHSIPR